MYSDLVFPGGRNWDRTSDPSLVRRNQDENHTRSQTSYIRVNCENSAQRSLRMPARVCMVVPESGSRCASQGNTGSTSTNPANTTAQDHSGHLPFVDLAAMPGIQNKHDEMALVDGVQHPVVADPDTQHSVGTDDHLRRRRARIRGERIDGLPDPAADWLVRDRNALRARGRH